MKYLRKVKKNNTTHFTLIKKQQLSTNYHLIGRRVRVPQCYTEVEDNGDGFAFGATIISGNLHSVCIIYDYTLERECRPISLVRKWLEPETDSITSILDNITIN